MKPYKDMFESMPVVNYQSEAYGGGYSPATKIYRAMTHIHKMPVGDDYNAFRVIYRAYANAVLRVNKG